MATVVVAVASLVVWGYAATFLTVSNTATVNLGASLTGVDVTSTTVCSATTGTYITSPSLAWNNVITGTTTKQFMCIHNTGTDAYPVTVTSSLLPSQGAITTPQAGQSVGVNGFLLVELDWAVAQGAPLGPTTFSISFQ